MQERPLDRRLAPVRFLAGTATRLQILDALADGPCSRQAVAERVDAPRTTLRRNLADLAERNWVTHDPAAGEYALTPAGRHARQGFRTAVDSADAAARTGTFLDQFPAELPVTADDIEAMTVSVVTSRDPHGPVSWLQSHLESTDELRGVLPAANPMYVASLTDLVADGFGFDLVGSETVFETFARDYEDELATLRAAEPVSLAVAPDPPEYGIGILDDYVFLVAYDDRLLAHSFARVPRTHDPLGTWALERYDDIAAEAVPLEQWADG